MAEPAVKARPALLIPAFSRPALLHRLLVSLNNAKFPIDDIQVVISLDGGGDSSVLEIAKQFRFRHGSVEVIERRNNIGLREHILWCGDQTGCFGSVIVLEDDLLVDPWFYHFACTAIEAYGSNDSIGGFALYAPEFNEFAELPFAPLSSGFTTYRMQVPCSWGQAWTAEQWQHFRAWYDSAKPDVVDSSHLPNAVKEWPESSWKKYYAAYLVDSMRYFIYPMRSYTTNCGDPGGTHMKQGSNRYQVSLGFPDRNQESIDLRDHPSSLVSYDAFMEPHAAMFARYLPVAAEKVCVDLYGTKPHSLIRKYPFCLTLKSVENSICSFTLRFRPLPANIFHVAEDNERALVALCHTEELSRAGIIDSVKGWYRLRTYYAETHGGILSGLALSLMRLLNQLWSKFRESLS